MFVVLQPVKESKLINNASMISFFLHLVLLRLSCTFAATEANAVVKIFNWQQRDSNPQPFSSLMNTQPNFN